MKVLASLVSTVFTQKIATNIKGTILTYSFSKQKSLICFTKFHIPFPWRPFTRFSKLIFQTNLAFTLLKLTFI